MPRSKASLALRGARLLAVLALAFASFGCVKKPTMKLDHAELTGVRIAFPPSFSVLMTIVVDVTNPNSYDVAVRAVRGQVFLANRYPLPVDFRAAGNGVWLPAGQTTPVRVPVNVPIDLAVQVLREAAMSPSIAYGFNGHADVTATSTFQLEKDDYSVSEQGALSQQQLQGALSRSF